MELTYLCRINWWLCASTNNGNICVLLTYVISST